MDIADSTIVAGVLHRLFDAGWVLVATCNRTPEEFAASMMHREHPQARFTKRILERCETVQLRSSDARGESVDYRSQLCPADEPMHLSPLDDSTSSAADARFHELSRGVARRVCAPIGSGRSLPLTASPCGVARIRFAELCAVPLGATDYIALAQQFHTVFVLDVQQLSLRERDQARRFITLIDQLYNHKTKLFTTAAVPLESLFTGKSGHSDAEMLVSADLEGLEFEGEAGKAAELNPIGVTANSLAPSAAGADTATVSADSRKALVRDSLFTGEDEIFAFRRALSRLHEMQSVTYLGMRHRG